MTKKGKNIIKSRAAPGTLSEKRIIEGKEYYICKKCEKKYTSSGAVSRHYVLKHNNVQSNGGMKILPTQK